MPAPRRRLLADIAPLRDSADFRRLYVGQLVSFLGSQLAVVAVPYQVFLLTRSSFQVGLVSLAQLGPLLVGSLVGGAVADRMDRRRPTGPTSRCSPGRGSTPRARSAPAPSSPVRP